MQLGKPNILTNVIRRERGCKLECFGRSRHQLGGAARRVRRMEANCRHLAAVGIRHHRRNGSGRSSWPILKSCWIAACFVQAIMCDPRQRDYSNCSAALRADARAALKGCGTRSRRISTIRMRRKSSSLSGVLKQRRWLLCLRLLRCVIGTSGPTNRSLMDEESRPSRPRSSSPIAMMVVAEARGLGCGGRAGCHQGDGSHRPVAEDLGSFIGPRWSGPSRASSRLWHAVAARHKIKMSAKRSAAYLSSSNAARLHDGALPQVALEHGARSSARRSAVDRLSSRVSHLDANAKPPRNGGLRSVARWSRTIERAWRTAVRQLLARRGSHRSPAMLHIIFTVGDDLRERCGICRSRRIFRQQHRAWPDRRSAGRLRVDAVAACLRAEWDSRILIGRIAISSSRCRGAVRRRRNGAALDESGILQRRAAGRAALLELMKAFIRPSACATRR